MALTWGGGGGEGGGEGVGEEAGEDGVELRARPEVSVRLLVSMGLEVRVGRGVEWRVEVRVEGVGEAEG